MKKIKIATFNFGEYNVDATEGTDRFGNEVVRFELYKKGSGKKYMFGITKNDADKYMQSGELEEFVASNLPRYIEQYEQGTL